MAPLGAMCPSQSPLIPVDFQDSCHWVLPVSGRVFCSRTIITDSEEHPPASSCFKGCPQGRLSVDSGLGATEPTRGVLHPQYVGLYLNHLCKDDPPMPADTGHGASSPTTVSHQSAQIAVAAHCLTQIVTLRKWLPQINITENQGDSRAGGGICSASTCILIAV